MTDDQCDFLHPGILVQGEVARCPGIATQVGIVAVRWQKKPKAANGWLRAKMCDAHAEESLEQASALEGGRDD